MAKQKQTIKDKRTREFQIVINGKRKENTVMKERVTGKPAYGKKLPLQGIVGNKDNNLWGHMNIKKEQDMHLGISFILFLVF